MWLKVWKTFRNGQSKDDYIEIEEGEEKDEAEYWADHTSGGLNYGWTVYWEKIESPPPEWIRKRLINLVESINSIRSRIREYEKLLGYEN